MRVLRRVLARLSVYVLHFDFEVFYFEGESMESVGLIRFSGDVVFDRGEIGAVRVLGPPPFLNAV
jgi:hypothetical protein